MLTNTSRTFRFSTNRRPTPDGNFGAVRTLDTEVLTERDGGLQVDTHVTGTVEGARVDHRTSKFWPGVTMATAVAYRLRNGYSEVA
jgi:hypothetical protein